MFYIVQGIEDEFFRQYPILADIARFERRLLTAFDAADTNEFALEGRRRAWAGARRGRRAASASGRG